MTSCYSTWLFSARFEPEETSTFFSRDGGLTWAEAHKARVNSDEAFGRSEEQQLSVFKGVTVVRKSNKSAVGHLFYSRAPSSMSLATMEVSLSWQMISRRLGRSRRSTVLQVGFGGCMEVSYSRWLFIGDWWTKLRSWGMIEWVDIVPFPFSRCRCFGVYWPVLRPGTECTWFKGAMQHIRTWASKCCLHRDKLQTRFGCDIKHTTGIDKLIAMPMNISIAFHCNVLVSCFLSYQILDSLGWSHRAPARWFLPGMKANPGTTSRSPTRPSRCHEFC